jgi:DnaJ C terminal domain
MATQATSRWSGCAVAAILAPQHGTTACHTLAQRRAVEHLLNMDTQASGTQFVITTAPDPRFERRGSDLHHNVTISLVDALVGFTMEVSGGALQPQHVCTFACAMVQMGG